MTKFSITKNPGADNVFALAQGDEGATAIEVTKNPGNATVTFQKNAATKARIVKSGAAGGEYSQDMAVFSSEYMRLDISSPQWTQGEVMLMSFWIEATSTALVRPVSVSDSTGDPGQFALTLNYDGDGTANTQALFRGTTTDPFDTSKGTSSPKAITPQNILVHYMLAHDGTNGYQHVYVPGNGITNSDFSAPSVAPDWDDCTRFHIGAGHDGLNLVVGSIGDIWYRRGGTFANPQLEAVYSKFRDENNNPIDPGATGTGYDATWTPGIFISKAADWASGENKGSLGGTFSFI